MKKLCALTLFAVAACSKPPIEIATQPIPQEFLTCDALPDAPDVDALTAYNISGALYYSKRDVDARDAVLANWIVNIRGAWFSCSNSLRAVSEFEAERQPD